eukprot:m.189448 g.189448  ORF g.189448 m.189448 type:complete len:771 (+) comp17731_c0_seq1:198-2510(+)
MAEVPHNGLDLASIQEEMTAVEARLLELPEYHQERANLALRYEQLLAIVLRASESEEGAKPADHPNGYLNGHQADSASPAAGDAPNAYGVQAPNRRHAARPNGHHPASQPPPEHQPHPHDHQAHKPGHHDNANVSMNLPRAARRKVDAAPGELRQAMRLFHVDKIDTDLFSMYASPPPQDVDESAGAGMGQYHKLYFADMCNLVRDLIWIRDGPESPNLEDARRVALYIAWRGVSLVQHHHPEIDQHARAGAPYIDVATFHHLTTDALWTQTCADFELVWGNNAEWSRLGGWDIGSLLINKQHASPMLPSPRSVLRQLRAIQRYGRVHGAPSAVGEPGVSDVVWEGSDRVGMTNNEETRHAADALCAVSLFEPVKGGGCPDRAQIAELIMIVTVIVYGHFAIEFATARVLANAVLDQVNEWDGGLAWVGKGPQNMYELLSVWDELVSSPSVQKHYPHRRRGPIPNPVTFLPQVLHAAQEAERTGRWVFLDSSPPGDRVPYHMLSRNTPWRLVDHQDDDQTGILYTWPPKRHEYTYVPVQRQQAYLASHPERQAGAAAGGIAHDDQGHGGAPSMSPPLSVVVDEPAFVIRVPQEEGNTGEQPKGGWDILNDIVTADGGRLVECGGNGACFFNSIVYLLGMGNMSARVTIEEASNGPAWELRNAVMARMRETMPEMQALFGPTVPYYDDGTTTWEDYLTMLHHPMAWVHGEWEINATADVIHRVIGCIQYEDEILSRVVVGVPLKADGPKLLLARHADHYMAVERAQGGGVW